MTFRKPTLAAGVLAALLAVGCDDNSKSSSSSTHDRDRDGIADKYDRHPNTNDRLDDDVIIGRDRSDRRDSRRGLDEIPRDAIRVNVEEGEGQRLRHKPQRNGRIYVYDENNDRVVYDSRLDRGEEFILDPDKDVLTVDGKRISNFNVSAKHRYRLYFLRDTDRL
jgi:hypothetical protein